MFSRLYNSFVMSLGMFTCIPTPIADFSRGTQGIMGAFPLVGLVIGLLWWGLAVLCQMFVPNILAGCIIAVFPFLITGFIHLDGFMDVCDAVMSRRPLEERLRILKDPNTGAFAVCSLVILMLVFFAAASEIVMGENTAMLLFIPVISRTFSATAVLSQKPLPTSSLAAGFKAEANRSEIFMALAFGAVSVCTMVFYCGFLSLVTLVAMLITQLLAVLHCKKQLGGFSGDVAGYMLTLGELSAVVSLALWR